jgi:phosphate transport system permease protein
MIYTYFIPLLFILSLSAYALGTSRAKNVARTGDGGRVLHSLPGYYGIFTAICCAGPTLLLYGIWQVAESSILTSLIIENLPPEILKVSPAKLTLIINDIRNVVAGDIVVGVDDSAVRQAADSYIALRERYRLLVSLALIMVTIVCAIPAYRKITPTLRARNRVEQFVQYFLIGCSAIAILTTIGIVLSVLFEAIRFFQIIDITEFLFGLTWSPQTAIREGQAGSSGAFGAVPIFAGTMLIALIAMMVAIPIGLMSAIYLSEYAGQKLRTIAKPLLEILAGIPTVVYGFFAALVVAPMIRDAGAMIGLNVASESALAAGAVMGVMIIPFVSSLSDDVIHAVPQTLRDGSYALGATKYETIRSVVIPAALPGIVGGIMLAVSRAIGETMIVVMAAGLSANLTANPFEAVTTVTVQIVTLLVGDQEFDSPKTLAAFALGLVLFAFTLILNFIALRVVRKYREQYE